MMQGFRLLVLGLLVGLAKPALAAHTDYYVDCVGGAGSACTVGSPCDTIQKAVNLVPTGTGAGTDTKIHVALGTCTVTGATSGVVFNNQSGTSGAHLILTGVNDRTVVANGRGVGYSGASTVINGDGLNSAKNGIFIGGNTSGASYIDIQNLTLTTVNGATQGSSFAVDIQAGTGAGGSTHDITVSNVEATGWGKNGVIVLTSPGIQSSTIALTGNYIHDNDQINALNSRGQAGGWGQGIGIQGCSGCTVSGNVVQGNWGEGIDCFNNTGSAGTGNTISGNFVYNNFSVEVYFGGGCINTTVNANVLITDDPTHFRTANSGTANFQIIDETSSVGGSTGLTFTNNVTVGGNFGFSYSNFNQSLGLQGALIYNNTFINPSGAGISVLTSTTPSAGDFIYNNAFYTQVAGSVQASVSGVAGLAFDYQVWNGNSGSVVGAHDVTADMQVFGGTAATVAPTYTVTATPTVNTGGSGCTGGDGAGRTLTMSGGTSTSTMTVSATVASGAIASVQSVSAGGSYTVLPNIAGASSNNQTTFTGSGCSDVTLVVVWASVAGLTNLPAQAWRPFSSSPVRWVGSPGLVATDYLGKTRFTVSTLGAFEVPGAFY